MKVINEDARNGVKRCFFDDWRFCGRCGRCHSDKKEGCKRDCADFPKDCRDRCEPGSRHEPHEECGWAECREPCWRDESGWFEGRPCCPRRPDRQTHVHEFEGSTGLAGYCADAHNHRFAGVSGEAIRAHGSHIHKIWSRTDFFDHFHYICRFTGPAIPVFEEKNCRICGRRGSVPVAHVHFAEGVTTRNDGHLHRFRLATLIESPLFSGGYADAAGGRPQ